MHFKIDTKDTFSIIKPLIGEINAKLTGALQEKCEEMRQSGSKNFIIDLQECKEIDKPARKGLIALHTEVYSREQSLVFTGINDKIMEVLKDDETIYLLK